MVNSRFQPMRFVFLLLLLVPAGLLAQRNFTLQLIAAGKDTSFLSREWKYQKRFGDTLSRMRQVEEVRRQLIGKGYLECSVDSFHADSSHLVAYLSAGRLWKWVSLKNGNVDDLILQRTGFREKLFDDQPVSPEMLSAFMESILFYCENSGYPFAAVYLDRVEAGSSGLSAFLFLQKNQLVTIDSLIIKGDARIARPYLANYLGLRLPSVYKEQPVQRAESRLNELPFLTSVQKPYVLFSENHAKLVLSLKKKNASRFDFVLGILPNSSETGKLLVNGDGELYLANPFGRGESIFVGFSQLRARTTRVDVSADYPYLIGLPFGLDGVFNLYKNDTLYLDIRAQIGLKYLFAGSSYLKAFYRNAQTNIISFDSTEVIEQKTLPDYLDTRTDFYGLEYFYENLDYRFNPSRGWRVKGKGQAGFRSVSENPGIVQLSDPEDPGFAFSSLYDSVEADQSQYLFEATIEKYFEATPHSIFKAVYDGGALLSDDILENELFRIGGFQRLRGFDEESIYVSQFHIVSAEYHYLLARNSYFYLFFDASYVENSSATPFLRDTPFGFGAGLNFETRAGIFGLSYALGRQLGNPIQFSAAKLHFGYVTYF